MNTSTDNSQTPVINSKPTSKVPTRVKITTNVTGSCPEDFYYSAMIDVIPMYIPHLTPLSRRHGRFYTAGKVIESGLQQLSMSRCFCKRGDLETEKNKWADQVCSSMQSHFPPESCTHEYSSESADEASTVFF